MSNKPLKQTRDPYFNPKLQVESEFPAHSKMKLIANPNFGIYPDPDSTIAAPTTHSANINSANTAKDDSDQPQSITVWVPPIPYSNPTNAPNSASIALETNKLKSNVDARSEASDVNSFESISVASHLNSENSIIRTKEAKNEREVVGDFSADLSQLRRTTIPETAPKPTFGSEQLVVNEEQRNAAYSNTSSNDFVAVLPQPNRSSFPKEIQTSSQALSSIQPNGTRDGLLTSQEPDIGFGFQPPLSSTATGVLQTKSASPPSSDKPTDTTALSSVTGDRNSNPIQISTEKPRVGLSDNPALEPTRLLAMVGNEPVFVGDMLFELNQMIEKHMSNAPDAIKERERQNGIAVLLNKYIDSKLLYVDTLRKLPEGADINKVIEQAAKEFDKTAVPTMMKSAGMNSLSEFDVYLRLQGSSLRKLRLSWSQDQITRYFVSQELEVDKEITHRELLDEFQRRIDEYAIPAKARWEQITVRFDRTSSRAEAERLLVEMGNKIVYGANFASVAKKGSHGFTAGNGGWHDWTAKGELASKELDAALFSEPVGRLSDKIVTPEGIHIIRVRERTDATHTPFVDAQVEIKLRLQDAKRVAAFEKHIAKLRKEIPVVRYENDGVTPIQVADAPNSLLNR